jgi:hypothetical protein
VRQSPRWRFWRVRDTDPPVEGAGRMTAEDADGFSLQATRPGTTVIRQRWTRYWTVASGDACVRPDGDWTAVEAHSAGTIVVRASFSAARAIGRGEGRCSG